MCKITSKSQSERNSVNSLLELSIDDNTKRKFGKKIGTPKYLVDIVKKGKDFNLPRLIKVRHIKIVENDSVFEIQAIAQYQPFALTSLHNAYIALVNNATSNSDSLQSNALIGLLKDVEKDDAVAGVKVFYGIKNPPTPNSFNVFLQTDLAEIAFKAKNNEIKYHAISCLNEDSLEILKSIVKNADDKGDEELAQVAIDTLRSLHSRLAATKPAKAKKVLELVKDLCGTLRNKGIALLLNRAFIAIAPEEAARRYN
ncbi:MAG: hypothetical protein LBS74_04455 [Oscillospiraceae bacterium]|jgi:hypothetical protein|nr:hypothetical protein [Oscillospiraceae bacterium]